MTPEVAVPLYVYESVNEDDVSPKYTLWTTLQDAGLMFGFKMRVDSAVPVPRYTVMEPGALRPELHVVPA